MEHHSQCLDKIWPLVPYTKYGNSCQNATSWLVYKGESLNPPPNLRALRCTSKIDLPLLRARRSSFLLAASTTSPWALK